MTSHRKPDDPRFSPISLRKELIAEGYTDRAIRAMLEQGQLAKLRRGAYVDAGAFARLDAAGRHELLVRAVLKQAKTELVPSHASGVTIHDGPIYGLDLGAVDATRLDMKAGRSEAGVRQHRGRIIDGDVVSRHGIRVISPTRNALEVTTQVGVAPALCVMNDYLHRELTTVETLKARYEQGIEHWGNTLNTGVTLRLAHPKIESVAETLAWFLMWQQRLPRPEPQWILRHPDGEVGARLDFAWPDLGAYLEVDGKKKYLKLLQEGETPFDVMKRERDREEWVFEQTGWRVVRVLWDELFQPARTAAKIRRTLYPTAAVS